MRHSFAVSCAQRPELRRALASMASPHGLKPSPHRTGRAQAGNRVLCRCADRQRFSARDLTFGAVELRHFHKIDAAFPPRLPRGPDPSRSRRALLRRFNRERRAWGRLRRGVESSICGNRRGKTRCTRLQRPVYEAAASRRGLCYWLPAVHPVWRRAWALGRVRWSRLSACRRAL